MKTSGITLLRAAQLFSSPPPMIRHTTYYGPGIRDWRVGGGNGNGSIAVRKRHDRQPHSHAREIARRLRQTISSVKSS